MVTLKLESGNCLHFQVDTGAQCNLVPLDLYKKAPKDHELAHMMPDRQKITAYGGGEILVIGKVYSGCGTKISGADLIVR